MVSDDIYTALSGITGIYGPCDTKLPDNYVVSTPAVVFSHVSDVPIDISIDGPIERRESRWQVAVHALDLRTARAVKEQVIAALHGYVGGAISRADFESCPGELFDASVRPFQYFIPIDFLIQH